MDNRNGPIDMWNWPRPSSAVGCWNSKQNGIVGKKHPDVLLQVQKLKQEAELVSCQRNSVELGQPGQKQGSACVKQEERIE
jgi:hypothetical protein